MTTCLFAAGFMLSACSDDAYYGTLNWTDYDDTNEEATNSSTFYRSIVFTSGDDGYAAARIPTLVKTSTGTLLAFAEGRVESTADNGNIDLIMKRSTDNGETWSDLVVLADDGDNKCGNPAPVALSSGRVIVLYSWNASSDVHSRLIYKIYSDDDGLTWSEAEDITSQIKLDEEYLMTIGPVHGIVKEYEPNVGRIIFPARCSTTVTRSTGPAHVIYSDDGGDTWEKGAFSDYEYGNEGTVVELATGEIILNMRNADTETYYRYDAMSVDGGESFETCRMTDLVEPTNGGCQGSILKYGVDSDTGESILLFSNPTHVTSRRYGAIKVSVDSGDTWTKMYQYVPSSGTWMSSAYSDMALLNDGTIGVIVENGSYSRVIFISVDYDDIVDDYTY